MGNGSPRRPNGRRASNWGRRLFWSCTAIAALVCVMGVVHTWTRVAVLERSYELGKARDEHESLLRERARLRLEVATLQAASRVDSHARSSLSMVKPSPERLMVIDAQPVKVSARDAGAALGALRPE